MGAEGIFLQVKDEYHLVVSITLLQRAISVVIETDAVAPLLTGGTPRQVVRELEDLSIPETARSEVEGNQLITIFD